MKHSVSQVPSYEEYFGLVDNIITDDEFKSDENDEEIKKMIILALSLLQEFYLEYQYASEYDIRSEEFEMALLQFADELKDSLNYLFSRFVENISFENSIEYNLHTTPIEDKLIDLKRDLEIVVDSGIDKVIGTLRLSLKNKADFYTELAITTGMFSLHADFRRAIKELTNVISNNAQYAQSRINRNYLEFVYGQDALYTWNVTGVNTCAWCYDLASKGAMPLSWFPVDHPNGGCWLEPVNPDEYSQEYKDLMGW